MPIYDYCCKQCGKQREVHQSMDASAPKCPNCGTNMERQILFAPAVHGHMARGREQAMRSLPDSAHGKGCPCCSKQG
ncbi:MAG: zinc ribbon domain-containing protein [Gammaproteobacteria bacterium]|nr:zinc ribbon domain-containing protein [Gammaproteobacteria bacterium]